MVMGMAPDEERCTPHETVAFLTREDLRAEMQRELRQLAVDFERQLCDATTQLRTHVREDNRHLQMLSQMNTSEEMQRIFKDLREVCEKSLEGPCKFPAPPLRQDLAVERHRLPHGIWSKSPSPDSVNGAKQPDLPLMLVDVDEDPPSQLPNSALPDRDISTAESLPCKKVQLEPHPWTTVIPGEVSSTTSPRSPKDAAEPTRGQSKESNLSLSKGHQEHSKNSLLLSGRSHSRCESGAVSRPSSRMIVSHKTRSRISQNQGGKKNHEQNGVNHVTTIASNSLCANAQSRLLELVNHSVFDYVVTVIILLNGVMVGVQTHVMALEVSDVTPVPFQVLEWIFCVVFTVEISLRLVAYRTKFFTMSGKGWNIFDLLIVTLQLVEIMMEIVAAGLGFSFNLLRILRLIRVIRLARALRLIGELRTIVSSIAGSMKSLFWTGVLLFMIVYVLGVGITQHVLNKRILWEKNRVTVPNDLEHFWGDLIRSIFSLFQAITGGVDWDQVARPLIDYVGFEMGLVFTLYITFAVLAMLNVVTGVFIESVMKNASLENELRTQITLTNLFRSLDFDNSGEISWEQFQKQLDSKKMKEFFKTIDVDISNARGLFELLDLDGSDSVNAEEFVDGCLRIWNPAKGLDLRMIRREVTSLSKQLERLNKRFDLEHCEPRLSLTSNG